MLNFKENVTRVNYIVAAVAFILVPAGSVIINRFPHGSLGMWVGFSIGCVGVIVMLINVCAIFLRGYQQDVDQVLGDRTSDK
ncbi:hypothetical protein [Kocuria sp.]|uniref:hypothetical protein n=1 Tax=Kocuria sp. TaxID=1871328 RepID=UPI0026DF94A6|nr:hypothetical protein [Kocuria sp.]MDO5619003.1 hypothetical protein [Kocuria sp.]